MNLKLLSKLLLVVILALMITGSALVLSASSTYSALKFNHNSYYLFFSYLGKLPFALIGFVLFSKIPYTVYRRFSKKAIMVTAIVLFITAVLTVAVKGASRWISIGGLSFQPSEIAKLVLLMHVAYLIESKGEGIKDFANGFKYPVIWIFVISALVFVQPNVSTSIIIATIAFSVLFISGAKLKHIFATIGVAVGFAGVFAMIFNHSRERILTFISSFGALHKEINPQVAQAKIALGSGGFRGIGLGQSRQSDLFLPESYGDFIFSVLGEELGYIGVISVLLIYMVIFIIGILIAKNAKDQYGQLLAFSISFTIVLSAFINAAVVTGLFPTTGITLPFISYGGTSLIFMCCSAGILTNIALSTYKEREVKKVTK
ncbi:MAG: putative peptidoglycan glycosyltransferase FtsW [Ignavibacteria bacterium]